MRLMGLPRDYVMSFIVEPGRVITPAVVEEVMQGKIGPEVGPASLGAVETYVQERLAAVRAIGRARFDAAVSPWRVQQVLLWSRPDRASLLPNEGYEVDFKVLFDTSDTACHKYIKTMASFANFRGGYLFFGITDAGNIVEFDRQKFLDYDWERFDQMMQNTFVPHVIWDYSVVDIPDSSAIRLDRNIVEKIARASEKTEGDYKWLIESEAIGEKRWVGVLYAYPNEGAPVKCVRSLGKSLIKDTVYRRMMKRNQGFTWDDYVERFPSNSMIKTDNNNEFERRVNDFHRRLKAAEKYGLPDTQKSLFDD